MHAGRWRGWKNAVSERVAVERWMARLRLVAVLIVLLQVSLVSHFPPGYESAAWEVTAVFAAVAFEIDQGLGVGGPVGQHLAQGRQQHVVDLGAVDAGDVLQQRTGLVGVQSHGDRTHRPDRVGAVAVDGQRRFVIGGHRRPVRQLVGEPATERVITDRDGDEDERETERVRRERDDPPTRGRVFGRLCVRSGTSGWGPGRS